MTFNMLGQPSRSLAASGSILDLYDGGLQQAQIAHLMAMQQSTVGTSMSGNFSPQAQILRVTPATASEIKQIQALKARLEEPGSVALWRRPVDPEAARAALSAMLLHMNDGLRMPARDAVLLDTTTVGRAVTLRMVGEFIWIVNPVSSTGFTVADSRFYGWVDTRGQSFRRTHNAVCAHTLQRQGADTNRLLDAYAPSLGKSAEWTIEAMRLTLSAIEAGAWLYEAMPDMPAAVMYTRPTVGLDENGVPHAERGPAIRWPGMPGMPEVYCSHGVEMQRRWVMEPETITADMVTNENNAEQRRELMRLMGYERYVREGRFTLLSSAEKEFGDRPPKGLRGAKLWQKVWLPGDLRDARMFAQSASLMVGQREQSAVLIELQNSSKEPDGSYKTYFLRVPPEMRKVADAAAWTFGMSGKEYMGLAAET